MSRIFLPSVFGLIVVGCLVSSSVDAGPVSTEFQINQLTTGDQQSADVAATADGGFVVVWQSPVTPGDDIDELAVIGRRLDSSGEPIAGDFQINISTSSSQARPRISSRADGSFVVVWQTLTQTDVLQARTFDTAGNGAAEDFTVEVWPTSQSDVENHDVGATTGGGFVVAFGTVGYNYGTYSGQAHRRHVDNAGMVVEEAVMTPLSDRGFTARVSGDDTLGFVVSIHGRHYQGNHNNDIDVWRFDPSGVQVGSPFQVDPFPLDFREGTSADAALSPAGDFVVVWNGYDNSVNELQTEIYGRYVDAGGVPDPTGPVLINTATTGSQGEARIARGIDGSFLVVWESTDAPGDAGMGLRGRWLSNTGHPTGDEFAVNSYTTGDQRRPEVAAAADGQSFLVVWHSESGTGDVDGLSIRGRRFSLNEVFRDGFESGTTSAWSSTLPVSCASRSVDGHTLTDSARCVRRR